MVEHVLRMNNERSSKKVLNLKGKGNAQGGDRDENGIMG
jgi:hypothetical protein